MKTVRLYIQTAINLQRKCQGTPDYKNMENMLIDFTWLNVQAKYLIQTILYNYKWDMALWKSLKCPQYMQRTWWQTVATQHAGLTLLATKVRLILETWRYFIFPIPTKATSNATTLGFLDQYTAPNSKCTAAECFNIFFTCVYDLPVVIPAPSCSTIIPVPSCSTIK